MIEVWPIDVEKYEGNWPYSFIASHSTMEISEDFFISHLMNPFDRQD